MVDVSRLAMPASANASAFSRAVCRLRPRTAWPLPSSLLVNFYEQPDVGHSLIFSLWEGELGRVPDYIVPAQGWEPEPLSACPGQAADPSGYNHYWRTMGIWQAILKDAGFEFHSDPREFRSIFPRP